MSFITSAFAPRPLHSREEFMATFIRVAQELGLPDVRGAAVCAGMCAFQEAGADDDNGVRQIWTPGNQADPCFAANPGAYPHDSEGDDGRSTGPFQQQMGQGWGWGGALGDCEGTRKRMDMVESIRMFYSWPGSGLKDKGYDASNADAAGRSVQAVQGSAFPSAYAQWWDEANQLYDQVAGGVVPPVQPGGGAVPSNRPDFNEINQIGMDSANPHGSERSRPPINWFIHTQQGDGNAETLANFLRSTSGAGAVSYHYTVAEDPNDHGVTVCDVIDTDLYSWAVLNANVFSINGCFAGSYAEWTRDQWLSKMRNAIRVMAYLAVQDAKKYTGISTNVIVPPYVTHGPGISDHRYVTKALGIGTHVDVGGPMGQPWNGFPWDVFAADVAGFLAPLVPIGPSAPPPAVDTTPPFTHPSTDVMIRDLWDQARGPVGKGWPQDKDRTPVETIWALAKKAGV